MFVFLHSKQRGVGDDEMLLQFIIITSSEYWLLNFYGEGVSVIVVVEFLIIIWQRYGIEILIWGTDFFWWEIGLKTMSAFREILCFVLIRIYACIMCWVMSDRQPCLWLRAYFVLVPGGFHEILYEEISRTLCEKPRRISAWHNTLLLVMCGFNMWCWNLLYHEVCNLWMD